MLSMLLAGSMDAASRRNYQLEIMPHAKMWCQGKGLRTIFCVLSRYVDWFHLRGLDGEGGSSPGLDVRMMAAVVADLTISASSLLLDQRQVLISLSVVVPE
jgi:hypothetical protein